MTERALYLLDLTLLAHARVKQSMWWIEMTMDSQKPVASDVSFVSHVGGFT